MFCGKCGAENPDNSVVCGMCGSVLAQAPQQPQQAPYQQPSYEQAPQQPYQQAPQQAYQQPYQQAPQQTYGGGYKAPIQARNIVTCIILTIVTCGIYGIIWFIHMVDDLNTASNNPGDQNGITVWLLGLVTCGIYSIIWMYKAGEKVDNIKKMNGEAGGNNSLIYLLLTLFGLGIVAYCLIQSELNKVAATAA